MNTFDLDDPAIKDVFALVQRIIRIEQFSIETDEHSGLVVVHCPHYDCKRGRGSTLYGAIRDFYRANTAR